MPGYDSDPGAGPVRALIVDDEASARSRLRRHLAACPQVVIEGEADNGIAALEKIITLKPDLLFLDIQMPGMTGFEVLRNLPPDLERPHIVFVTGYDQHALDAFEADAIAYLLKPVQQQRLIQVVERIERLHVRPPGERLERVAAALSPPMRQVVVRHANRFLLLRPEDVVYFQIEDGITRAFTAAESYAVNLQIAQLEEFLPTEQFFRASRAVLINLYRIKEVRPFLKSTFLVVMDNTAHTEIQVGERRAKALRQKIPGL
jgi:two-component system LytT family response regulator